MNDSPSLCDKLRCSCATLLGCEAIGWLHMTGKAHPDFLHQHGEQKNGYKPKDWAEALVPDWNAMLTWISNDGAKSLSWPNKLSDFLSQFDKGGAKSVLGLLQAAHAMASGIEKNHPSNTTKYLTQDTTHLWLSTAFGHPVRNLLEDRPELLKEGGWQELLGKIQGLLTDLGKLGTQKSAATVEEWHRWRQQAIGPAGWLRQDFSQTLAETRLPNNDVTLWDQSYVAAALFKSAAAGAVLAEDEKDATCKWNNALKQQTQWRVLTVGVGAEHYEARAVRIGDWTGARRHIDGFFDKVCQLIEVELALGSLLYSDGEVLAFSFPGERLEKNGGLSDARAEDLRAELETAIDTLAQKAKLDTPPIVEISGSTRSMISMAREIEKASNSLQVPLHRAWPVPQEAAKKTNNKSEHTCPVCGLRANGSASGVREKKETPCAICQELRGGRLQDWLGGKLGGESLWISEVADKNDRVALVTLSLDLEGWLSGDQFDSLRAQSVVDWATSNSTGKKVLPPKNDKCSEWFQKAMGKGNEANQARSVIRKTLAPGLQTDDESKAEVPWEQFFKLVVEDRSDAPGWDDLKEQERAQWLTHQLFRKNASPGRLHRFWETTETFFEELLSSFRESASTSENRWRVRRLVVTPQAGQWQQNQTYAGHWGSGDQAAPLEFVCREDGKQLITISNLARVLGATEQPSALKDKCLTVVDDEGEPHERTIASVSEAPAPLGTYHPLMVLERSPSRFRLLVPLEAAEACVQAAVEKWKSEFARVWDRLPLRVGIVAFPRKLPFQAVVEAARNVEDDLNTPGQETWRVSNVTSLGGVTSLSLAHPGGEHQLVSVPTAVADGREDVFYPNCAVEGDQLREAHDFRAPGSKDDNGRSSQIYRWMPELRAGDGIRVTPARIARIFLDSTARRFEPVAVRALDDWTRLQETWFLVQEAAPSLTAARALESLLLEKQEAWAVPQTIGTETWLDFVRASLVNLWSVRGAQLDALVEATRRGILQETLAWYLHVLKQNTESGYDDE